MMNVTVDGVFDLKCGISCVFLRDDLIDLDGKYERGMW